MLFGLQCISSRNGFLHALQRWYPSRLRAHITVHADTSRSQSRASLHQHSFLPSYPYVAVEMSRRISCSVNLYLGPGRCLPGRCLPGRRSGFKLLTLSACVAIAASSRRQRGTVGLGTPVFLGMTLALFPSSIRAKTHALLGIFHSLECNFESGGGVGGIVVGGTIGVTIRARCKQRARCHGCLTTHAHSLICKSGEQGSFVYTALPGQSIT